MASVGNPGEKVGGLFGMGKTKMVGKLDYNLHLFLKSAKIFTTLWFSVSSPFNSVLEITQRISEKAQSYKEI
jgi:hypothetical protein